VDTYSAAASAFFLPGEWQVFFVKTDRVDPPMAPRAGS
jgi:hypothetical protein